MTTVTPTPDVSLPPGADANWDNQWENDEGRAYRIVWSNPLPLNNPWTEPNPGWRDNDVRLAVTQYGDGTISDATDDPGDRPLIYVGGESYSIESARALSAALLDAANLAEEWTGQESGKATAQRALIDAHRAVRNAWHLAKMKPGNAGDYLRAALDSLCDATEALR